MNHPHDKLFKATFSQPDVVASLIEDLFPPALVAEIDVQTLVLTTNSYIDNELKNTLRIWFINVSLTIRSPLRLRYC